IEGAAFDDREARVGREARRIARQGPNGVARLERLPEELAPDATRRSEEGEVARLNGRLRGRGKHEVFSFRSFRCRADPGLPIAMKRMNPFNRRMNDAHELGVLARIDLNLIVAFDALARDANVTAAATRLGVTQSAMSHRLRRLRELFGDPLLVRTRGGMALTPRAEALVVPVRSALSGVARALSDPGEFVPARAGRTFRIVAPDLFDALALAPMLELLRREAPGISLTMVP